MGTTAFWAMADLMPEVTESLVSLMVGLAPISVCGQMSGPVRYLAPISGQIERMMSFTGNSEFGTRQNILQVFPSLCEPVPVSEIQGLQYILTQNNSLLLQKFEHGRLPKPTGGSPDVVHLIINAPQGSE